MQRLFNLTAVLIILLLSLLTTGCSKKEIVKTFYLQDIKVTGPVNLAPVHISDTSAVPSFTISASFSYNTKKKSRALWRDIHR